MNSTPIFVGVMPHETFKSFLETVDRHTDGKHLLSVSGMRNADGTWAVELHKQHACLAIRVGRTTYKIYPKVDLDAVVKKFDLRPAT